MSWSANFKIIDSEFNIESILGFIPDVSEVHEALDSAMEAVRTLVTSAAFGNMSNVDFQVNISGHANPGHVPAPGWANDCITISISQLTRASE